MGKMERKWVKWVKSTKWIKWTKANKIGKIDKIWIGGGRKKFKKEKEFKKKNQFSFPFPSSFEPFFYLSCAAPCGPPFVCLPSAAPLLCVSPCGPPFV